MKDGITRKLYKASVGLYRPRSLRRDRHTPFSMGEEVPATAGFDPCDTVRWHIALDEGPRPLAPEIEIIRIRQLDNVVGAEFDVLERSHTNSSSCSVFGASRLRRSARSVRVIGRQSIVQMKGRTLVMDWVSSDTSSNRRPR